jgi:hypothetical protein
MYLYNENYKTFLKEIVKDTKNEKTSYVYGLEESILLKHSYNKQSKKIQCNSNQISMTFFKEPENIS